MHVPSEIWGHVICQCPIDRTDLHHLSLVCKVMAVYAQEVLFATMHWPPPQDIDRALFMAENGTHLLLHVRHIVVHSSGRCSDYASHRYLHLLYRGPLSTPMLSFIGVDIETWNGSSLSHIIMGATSLAMDGCVFNPTDLLWLLQQMHGLKCLRLRYSTSLWTSSIVVGQKAVSTESRVVPNLLSLSIRLDLAMNQVFTHTVVAPLFRQSTADVSRLVMEGIDLANSVSAQCIIEACGSALVHAKLTWKCCHLKGVVDLINTAVFPD